MSRGHPHDQLLPLSVRRAVRGVQFFLGLFALIALGLIWPFGGFALAGAVVLAAVLLIRAVAQLARIAWVAGYSGGHADSLELWTKLPRHNPAAQAAQNITAAASIRAGQRIAIRRNGEAIPLSQ